MPIEQSFDARLVEDMKAAMRAHDDVRVNAIRFVRSAAKNRQIELGHPLTNEEMNDVIRKQVKQRQDAVEQFRTAGRQELADKEQADLEVLQGYLPQQMDRSAVEAVAREVITELGATGPADMRRVMPALVTRLQGQADGRLLSDVAGALLRRA
ncbi:MAG TPA: GatB/YqeY domain-containing protein [Chloroflexota bacterium]|jgi:hypothetical protein|nr:GatB/YqeY domain-containing protein [Chloroflexota bacterium]